MFVIKYNDDKGNVKFLVRKSRSTISDYRNIWPENARIAEIDTDKLKWEKIIIEENKNEV